MREERKETKEEIKKQKKVNKKAKRKNSVGWKIFRTIMILLLIAFIAFLGWFGYRWYKNGGGLTGFLVTAVGHDENTLKDLDRINILVMGESGVGDGYNLADSIMICSYNPKTQDASILSIPRDTYIGKKDRNSANTSVSYLQSYKMNAAYRNGTNIPETVQYVSDMTQIDLKYYVIVDTDSLIEIVDALGGITFNVPIDMEYDDPTQDLHIKLTAGEQHIDGNKAEQLLRFRHNNDGTTYSTEYGDNDLGRMRTQREFMQATMKQVLKIENLANGKIFKVMDIAFKNIKTNIDINVMKDYVPYVVNFKGENLRSGMLPGEPEKCNGVWIYTYNKTQTKTLVEELFADKEQITDEEVSNVIKNTQTNGNTTTSTKVEILNGTGDTTKLEAAAKALKEAGFEVIKTGKSSSTSKTTIIHRSKKAQTEEKKIKEKLGVGVITEGDSSSQIDFTIILGKDY